MYYHYLLFEKKKKKKKKMGSIHTPADRFFICYVFEMFVSKEFVCSVSHFRLLLSFTWVLPLHLFRFLLFDLKFKVIFTAVLMYYLRPKGEEEVEGKRLFVCEVIRGHYNLISTQVVFVFATIILSV